MAGQRLQHLAGGEVGRVVGAVHGHVGLGEERVARGHQALQHLARVASHEERAVLAADHAAQQGRQAAAEPDGDGARLTHGGAGARIGEGAAAGGQHQRWAGQQPGDDAALAVAEVR